MATLEGPLLSLKNVNAIAHFTDWIVAHVHVGALGWNGLMTFGILYWIMPRIYNTKLYSQKLANAHFWLATLGIAFYAIPMYWSGWQQGQMWKDFGPDGMLVYPEFIKTTISIRPMHIMRSLGGTIYLGGVFVMVYNLIKTVKSGSLVANENAEAPALMKHVPKGKENWHRVIERKPLMMLVLSLIVIMIGGIVEMVPTFLIESNVPTIAAVKPYTPLELEGRDLYIKEGCVGCHSQTVRPFRSETMRYGEYSKAGEFVYDHPFLWGSKRTGPDLSREGTLKLYKQDSWHYYHFIKPSEMTSGSIMPSYAWLTTNELDVSKTGTKIKAMRTLGVPYPEGYENQALADLEAQAQGIADNLNNEGVRTKEGEKVPSNTEVIALIAYLQRLGTDITKTETAK